MPDQRMLKLAEVLVRYSAAVQPGEWVAIQGDVLALPLITEVYRLVTRAGGLATVQISADELDEAFFSEAMRISLHGLRPQLRY